MPPAKVLVVLGSFVLGSGCGGGAGGARPVTPSSLTDAQIDADPLALLPGAAVLIASVDAHAFYSSDTVGAQMATLSEQLFPIGDESGFKASRDIDRIIAGTYSLEGLDVSAVVTGRFDQAKIKQAALAHTPTHGGGVVTESQYAGRSVYMVGDAGFAVLTPKTALAGTQTGIRRALDRIQDGKVKHDVPSWAEDTMNTPNAAVTVTGDFTQPLSTAAIGAFSIPFVKGLTRIRSVADFKAPGMHVAATLTYDDGASATAAAGAIEQGATLVNALAITGLTPRLGDFTVNTTDANVQGSFSVDDQAMKKLLGQASSYLH